MTNIEFNLTYLDIFFNAIAKVDLDRCRHADTQFLEKRNVSGVCKGSCTSLYEVSDMFTTSSVSLLTFIDFK